MTVSCTMSLYKLGYALSSRRRHDFELANSFSDESECRIITYKRPVGM